MPEPPRHSYLIVDGHSIIFAWPELRQVHERNTAAARDLLCQRLRGYQDATGERIVVVFDGKGPKTSSERAHADDIQIMYSSGKKTADAVIERLVAKYSETYPITVATADRLEQITVHSFGGFCIDPDQLRERVDRADRETQRRLEQLRKRR